MNAVVPQVQTARPVREYQVVSDPVPMLDTARFEHMMRIAVVLADCSLLPDALTQEGKKGQERDLEHRRVVANAFMVVNQATRWNMDPFAVAQSVSVVKGKLCYEGKLVAAALESLLGIALTYEFNDKTGDAFGVRVSGKMPDGRIETIEGTVGDWKTVGDNSPWRGGPASIKRQLRYRGAREWARLNQPAVMLGVIARDELEELKDQVRANQARQAVAPPAPARQLAAPPVETEQTEPAEAQVSKAQHEDRSEVSTAASELSRDSTAETSDAAGTEHEESQPAPHAEFMALMEAASSEAELDKIIKQWDREFDNWNEQQLAEAKAAYNTAQKRLAPPAEAKPEADAGAAPNDILAELMEKLSGLQTEEAIELAYAEGDYEAELSKHEGFVERARAAKALAVQRVMKASAAQKAAEQKAPAAQPPAADDLPKFKSADEYVAYFEDLGTKVDSHAKARQLRDLWKTTKDVRFDLAIDDKVRMNLLRRLEAIMEPYLDA